MNVSRSRMVITVFVFIFYGFVHSGVSLWGQDRQIVIESVNDSGGQKYAFLVGVTEYDNTDSFPTLSYTKADVNEWEKQLQNMGVPKRNIVVMASNTSVPCQPTKRKIESSLRELLSKVGSDDIIICVFSGHGTQIGADQYFCPEDANVDKLGDSCIPLKKVLSDLKNSRAKFKWLVVDACRNDPTRSAKLGLKSISKVTNIPKGVTAIFSCADSEKSYEDPALGLGVFTNFLTKGLSGEAAVNGVVTILDLYKYVQDQTRDFVKGKYNQEQVPYWDGEFTNFTLRDDLLINGVSRLKWNEAQEAYQKAIAYRVNKDFANATLEIKVSLSILPTWREYMDEQSLIEYSSRQDPPVPPKDKLDPPPLPARMVLTIEDVEYAFRWCPPGEFNMGSPTSERGRFEEPGRLDVEKQHEVILTQGFWMLETEVTGEMWVSIMENDQSHFKSGNKKLPMEAVSWNNCRDFIIKLNSISNAAPPGLKFSLPTEAQWEYACRAGADGSLNSGNSITSETNRCDNLDELSWYGGNSSRPNQVGLKKPNNWGLYDMHGNVYEWCLDWYAPYPTGTAVDPIGPTAGTGRVMRGGAWDSNAKYCRTAYRDNDSPSRRNKNIGFRLCLVPISP